MFLFFKKINYFTLMMLILFLVRMPIFAAQSLQLENADLAETIRVMANTLKLNMIISPTIKASVNIAFTDAISMEALNLLLFSHGLAKWRVGNFWYVGSQEELIHHRQQALLLREAQENAAELKTQIWQIRYGKATEMARLLQDGQASLLSKRGIVRLDRRTNTICIRDTAASIHAVNAFITRVDVPIKQVSIEVRLVSIDSDFERELGLSFAQDKIEKNETDAAAVNNPYHLAIARLANNTFLDVKLTALENTGHAKLISSPSLFTSDRSQASIETGEEIPYQEVSESGGTAVAFKKAVLGLQVIPQVLPGNRVLLNLKVNQDRPGHKMVLGVPTIRTRQILTNVLLRTGQTIVLGGIYESDHEQGQKRLPFISELPIIGFLFQQHSLRTSRRELLIFVTPKII